MLNIKFKIYQSIKKILWNEYDVFGGIFYEHATVFKSKSTTIIAQKGLQKVSREPRYGPGMRDVHRSNRFFHEPISSLKNTYNKTLSTSKIVPISSKYSVTRNETDQTDSCHGTYRIIC